MKLLEIKLGNKTICSLFINRIELVTEGESRYELIDVEGNNIGFLNTNMISVTGENTAKVTAIIIG